MLIHYVQFWRFAHVRLVTAGLMVAYTGVPYLPDLRLPLTLFYVPNLAICLVAASTSIAFWRTGRWIWALALLGVVMVAPFVPLIALGVWGIGLGPIAPPMRPMVLGWPLNLAVACLMLASTQALPAYPKTSGPPNVSALGRVVYGSVFGAASGVFLADLLGRLMAVSDGDGSGVFVFLIIYTPILGGLGLVVGFISGALAVSHRKRSVQSRKT